MRVSKWILRALLIAVAGAWSAVMVIVGVLLVLDWPLRFGGWAKPWQVFGAALIAAGQFVFALVAARVFPLASGRVMAVFEALPWVGLLILVAGGWLW